MSSHAPSVSSTSRTCIHGGTRVRMIGGSTGGRPGLHRTPRSGLTHVPVEVRDTAGGSPAAAPTTAVSACSIQKKSGYHACQTITRRIPLLEPVIEREADRRLEQVGHRQQGAPSTAAQG